MAKKENKKENQPVLNLDGKEYEIDVSTFNQDFETQKKMFQLNFCNTRKNCFFNQIFKHQKKIVFQSKF